MFLSYYPRLFFHTVNCVCLQYLPRQNYFTTMLMNGLKMYLHADTGFPYNSVGFRKGSNQNNCFSIDRTLQPNEKQLCLSFPLPDEIGYFKY